MDLFAFLGTSPYSKCRYSSDPEDPSQTSPSVIFVQTAVALSLGEELENVTIFATSRALETHKNNFIQEFTEHDLPAPKFVLSPPGMTSQEMIALFEILNDEIKDSRSVVFDITHGYRSQPVLGLLILNYLRAVHPELEVVDIVYGAFNSSKYDVEAEHPPPIFPVISLKSLWELNEWASAFHTFNVTGDVRPLAQKATQSQTSHMKKLGRKPPEHPMVRNFAAAIEKWQNQLDICAVPMLFDPRFKGSITTKELQQNVENPWNELSAEIGRFVQPLKEKVAQTIEPMIADDWNSIEGLRAQIAIMRWMQEHKRYQPLLTMAREWLTVFMSLALKLDISQSDDLVGAYTAFSLGKYIPLKESEDLTPQLQYLSETFDPELRALCDGVTFTRNRVNHCWLERSTSSDLERPTDINPTKQVETVVASVFEVFPLLLEKLEHLKTPEPAPLPT